MVYNFITSVTEDENFVSIKGFPIEQFQRDLKRQWGTNKINNIYQLIFTWFSQLNTFRIHKFFIPELLYIFNQLPARKAYTNLISKVMENTWIKNTTLPVQNIVDFNRLQDISKTLKPYQLDFLYWYDKTVQQYSLQGYLNAFDQGLGKSITAISLMYCLHKDRIIIVAPNNTVYTTWVREIQEAFSTEQKIWTQNTPIKDAKWFIINYESMNKLFTIPELKDGSNIGIIVDEIHHFRNKNTNRSINAIALVNMTGSTDVLTMSGTPIKALGSEMIPLLKLIDPLFTDEVEDIFKRTFGTASTQLADIIGNRLNLVMYRKMKSEVLDLPEKIEKTIPVTIPNGKMYTLPVLQGTVKKFIGDRTEYYTKNKLQFEKDYNYGLAVFENLTTYDKSSFEEYGKIIKIIMNKEYKNWQDRTDKMKQANLYEKKVIEPALPTDIKRKFHKAKSVVKYVEMVILGEVIGGLLPQMRATLYSDIIRYGPINEMISGAIKKTILFTTYGQVVENSIEVCKKHGFNPIAVYQKTSKDSTTLIKRFREQENTNPLITTIQMMSTGVTLIEANTVIFAPTPFRYVDYLQASDRVYRIGQTDPCFIYTLILDTGEVPNLSTRIQEISDWSKDLFERIVGVKIATELVDEEVESAVESFNQEFIDMIKVMTDIY